MTESTGAGSSSRGWWETPGYRTAESPQAAPVSARQNAPLVRTAALPGQEAVGSPPAAILVGAVVAIVSGLVWAGVVIATKIDFGILAALGGIAVGAAMAQVAGQPLNVGLRVLGGLFAAAGIMVGKYVIFVHEVKQQLGAQLAEAGHPVGYFDSTQISIFVHHFGSIVKPIYALWVALAFFAALRAGAGRSAFARRR